VRSRFGSPRVKAFTLVEILIVISIIAILAGLLIPGVIKIRNMAIAADTETRMEALRTAFATYLEDRSVVGPHADGLHMVHDYARALIDHGDLEKVAKWAVRRTSDGRFVAANPNNATHIKDAWGFPILVQIKNEPLKNARTGEVLNADRFHTSEVYIRSEGGTGTKKADDIIYRFAFTRQTWERVYLLENSTESYWYVDVVP